MIVTLHLGAHKTATTYLQEMLGANRAALCGAGVDFWPTPEFRQTVTPLLPRRTSAKRSKSAQQSHRADLRRVCAARLEQAQNRLMISDENLLGTPQQIVESGRLYPKLGGHLAAMADVLSGTAVEIFLCIRPLSDFGRSIFSEVLRHPNDTLYEPEPFKAAWLEHAGSWVAVLEQIRALFPQSPITLWSFHQFRDLEPRILQLMLGLDALPDLDRSYVYRRPSLGHSAVEAMLAYGRAHGPMAMYENRAEIQAAHPRGKGDWIYRMWSEEERQDLHGRFRQDMRAIRRLDWVTLLRPDDPPVGQ
ncbi:MAG: hypothetical protein AAGE76_13265 [Pseudomonadota bacterium]